MHDGKFNFMAVFVVYTSCGWKKECLRKYPAVNLRTKEIQNNLVMTKVRGQSIFCITSLYKASELWILITERCQRAFLTCLYIRPFVWKLLIVIYETSTNSVPTSCKFSQNIVWNVFFLFIIIPSGTSLTRHRKQASWFTHSSRYFMPKSEFCKPTPTCSSIKSSASSTG